MSEGSFAGAPMPLDWKEFGTYTKSITASGTHVSNVTDFGFSVADLLRYAKVHIEVTYSYTVTNAGNCDILSICDFGASTSESYSGSKDYYGVTIGDHILIADGVKFFSNNFGVVGGAFNVNGEISVTATVKISVLR
jgi:hypothetical protein